MNCLALVIFLAAAARCETEQKPLPDFITPCRPKDDACLKNALERLRPYLVAGIPEFDMSPIDAIPAPNYNQTFTYPGKLHAKAFFSDMVYRGMGNFSISKAHVDLGCDGSAPRFELVLAFPQIEIATTETISARGYGLKVEGRGRVNATVSNVTISFVLSGTEQTQSHLIWGEEVIIVSYNDMWYWLEDSYKGRLNFDKFLKKIIAQPRLIRPAVELFIKNTLGNYILRALNIVHEMYPVPVLYSI